MAKTLELDDRNRAHVPVSEFMAYLFDTFNLGDYVRERDGIIYYFNSSGCKLAEYHLDEEYGQIF